MSDQPLETLRSSLSSAFRGDAQSIDLVLVALIAGGHVLLEDVPGVGKTTLARALARAVQGRFGRIQGTPDLMPADITGLAIYDDQDHAFRFHPGPVFNDILLVDELNRMPPRSQSALLEAFGEGQVSVDGTTRPLSVAFTCIATQNPHDHIGTYPLPESQTDRFLLRFSLGYPSRNEELAIMAADGADQALAAITPCCDCQTIAAWRQQCRQVNVTEEVRGYIQDIVRATRATAHIELGASPRAALGLQRAAQAQALLDGRDFAIPDDVQRLAPAVLAHRIRMRADRQVTDVLESLIDGIPIPR